VISADIDYDTAMVISIIAAIAIEVADYSAYFSNYHHLHQAFFLDLNQFVFSLLALCQLAFSM
jgi:purine-cytosine permease-like protein